MPLRDDSLQSYLNELLKLTRNLSSGGGGGSATAANQVTGNNSLASIDTKLTTTNSTLSTISTNTSNVATNSVISTVNSSTTTLGIAGVFTGTSEDVSQYATIRIAVFSDQVSATNGLSLQQSSDGTNWDFVDTYTIPASNGQVFGVPIYARYFRVVYTNGGIAQGSFRIQTVYHKNLVKPSSIRPGDGRSNEIDTEEFSSYPMVYNGTTWDRARGTIVDGQYMTQYDKIATGNITVVNSNGTGAGTVGSFVGFTNLVGVGSCLIQVQGTYNATLQFQLSLDGTNWYLPSNAEGYRLNDGSQLMQLTGGQTGLFRCNLAGVKYFRVVCTAFTSGTASIIINATALESFVTSGSIQLFAGTNSIGNIGTVTPGTAATNLGKAEDAVAASGDTGIFNLGVRRDALLTSSSATADYNEMSVNRFGAQYIAGFRTAARTYSATANITLAANPTDICAIYGNASTTVQVTKIRVTGIQTTTGSIDFQLIRRSTANTGGTSSNFSLALHEVGDTANSTTPILYTANPTPGTTLGTMRRWYQPIGSQSSGIQGEYTLEFGENVKPIILSGITQGLVINLNGVAIAGGIINVSIEWIEF